ncbi:MAG: cell surface protein SprA, partial [bacterium]
YQLRLNEPDTIVGAPQWTRINYIRVWIDSVDSDTRVQIAQISLVGNEWRFKGIYASDDTTNYGMEDDSTLVIKVYNTDENHNEYKSPPGVKGEYDPIRKIHAREQALVLKLNNLPPQRTALAQKTLYQPVDLIQYKRLKMFVHGGDIDYTSFPPDSSPVEFFIQMGSDTKNENYYEIKYPVYPGWDERNSIDLPLEIFSQLKLQREADEDTSSIVLENGHRVTIVGSPTITKVRWLRAGLTNNTNTPFSGEVWINELRLSNVRKERGMAIRAKTGVEIGDFCSIFGSYDKKDADFHTVNERFGGGANVESYAVNVNVNIDRFLPPSWGLNIPVRSNYSKTLSTPKYMPGSDIIVDKDLMSSEQLNEIQTENVTKGVSISFSKSQRSRNFFGRYLLDPISAQASFRRTDQHTSQIRFSRAVSYNGSFNYNLNLNKQYSFKPLIWLGEKGFLGKIANFKIYYPFNNFTFKINATDSEKESETREGVPSSSENASFSNDFSLKLQPVNDLSVDFSTSDSYNMRGIPWTEILSITPERLDYQQKFVTKLSPRLFSWFSPSFQFNADYRWKNNIQRTTASKSAGVNSGFTINGKFTPEKFVQMFEKGTRSKTIQRPQTRRRREPQTNTSKENKEEQKEEEKDDKPSPLVTILSTIGNTFKGIEPITVNLSFSKTRNDQGILSSPSTAYKFGFSDEDLDYSDKVSQPRTGQRTNRLSMQSGINIANKVNVNFTYNYDHNKNMSSQTTETVSNSILYLGDVQMPFPNWTVRWNGLERIPFLSLVFQSININHGFNGKKTEQLSNGKVTNVNFSSAFNPLIGVRLRFKNDITSDIQYTNSITVSEQTQYGSSKSKDVSSKLIVSGQYSLKKGITLPIINKRFENTIDITLKFNMGNDVMFKKRGEAEKMTKSNFTKSWSLEPRISYTFSRSVQGGLHFEFGERKAMSMANRKIVAFGIHSSIRIG